ncbi:MAG: hypothetical protein PHI68_07130 [Candidatus Cloacimonetes bacterium]|nr:hypothetical protein [Candidatus Cloacimonadota bacterium]
MKRNLLVLVFILLGTLLLATRLDDELKVIYSQSEIMEHEGDTVLTGKSFLANESSAYE